jgi:GH15 family glucan-1,4-alpha-glucosidase
MQNLNYGVIGNCRTAALISETGNIEWFCFPNFDSPSIFSKILDQKKGGEFGFVVSEIYKISQKYIDKTNILQTRFESSEGIFEVIDFMLDINQ